MSETSTTPSTPVAGRRRSSSHYGGSSSAASSVFRLAQKRLDDITEPLSCPVMVDWTGTPPSCPDFKRKRLAFAWMLVTYDVAGVSSSLVLFEPKRDFLTHDPKSMTEQQRPEPIATLPLSSLLGHTIAEVPRRKAVVFPFEVPQPPEDALDDDDADDRYRHDNNDNNDDDSQAAEGPSPSPSQAAASPRRDDGGPAAVYGCVAVVLTAVDVYRKPSLSTMLQNAIRHYGKAKDASQQQTEITLILPSNTLCERLSALFTGVEAQEVQKALSGDTTTERSAQHADSIARLNQKQQDIDTSTYVDRFISAPAQGDPDSNRPKGVVATAKAKVADLRATAEASYIAARYGTVGVPPSGGIVYLSFGEKRSKRKLRVPLGSLITDEGTGVDRLQRVQIGPWSTSQRLRDIPELELDLTLPTVVGDEKLLSSQFYLDQTHTVLRRPGDSFRNVFRRTTRPEDYVRTVRRLYIEAESMPEKMKWVDWFRRALGIRPREPSVDEVEAKSAAALAEWEAEEAAVMAAAAPPRYELISFRTSKSVDDADTVANHSFGDVPRTISMRDTDSNFSGGEESDNTYRGARGRRDRNALRRQDLHRHRDSTAVDSDGNESHCSSSVNSVLIDTVHESPTRGEPLPRQAAVASLGVEANEEDVAPTTSTAATQGGSSCGGGGGGGKGGERNWSKLRSVVKLAFRGDRSGASRPQEGGDPSADAKDAPLSQSTAEASQDVSAAAPGPADASVATATAPPPPAAVVSKNVCRASALFIDLVSLKERFGTILLFDGHDPQSCAEAGDGVTNTTFGVTHRYVAALDVRDINTFSLVSSLKGRIHVTLSRQAASELDSPMSRCLSEGLFRLEFLEPGTVQRWIGFWTQRQQRIVQDLCQETPKARFSIDPATI